MLVVSCKPSLSLLLACLLLISFTRASTALTQDGFDSALAKGVSFVLFTSPYCGHCKVFAPTWVKLVEHSRVSPDVQLAQVDCSVSRALCNAQSVKGYPQMNLYRDGGFAGTYSGRRDFDLLAEYLAAAAAPSLLNPNGKVTTVLGPQNFTATIALGPAFVSFCPQYCNDCPPEVWKELAAVTKHRVTIAEVYCGGDDDSGFCRAPSIPVGAGYEPPALVYYPSEGAPVPYPGPLTLAPLREFTELGGIYFPPLMELTRETHRTVMAAPLIVLATVGKEAEENVVARMVRIRETALDFYRYGLLGGRAVQFVWENPKRDNGMVRDPLPADVDVDVRIVDHEDAYEARGTYLTDSSGGPIKLTDSSIFSVLSPLSGIPYHWEPDVPLLVKVESAETGVGDTETGVGEWQTMQYPYSANMYVL